MEEPVWSGSARPRVNARLIRTNFVPAPNGSYLIIVSQLWLTSHPRSIVLLFDTGTPGTSREIYSDEADDETRTRNPSVINRVL